MNNKNISIDTLGLSVRSTNALLRTGIRTVDDLLNCSEENLCQIRNLGKKSVEEILKKIEECRKGDSVDISSTVSANDAQGYIVQDLIGSDAGKKQILLRLEKKKIKIDELKTLSARSYNTLIFSGYIYMHQIVFKDEAYLFNIPRMNNVCASEIIGAADAFISEFAESIVTEINNAASSSSMSLYDMLFIPEYHDSILKFVLNNDVSVADLSVPSNCKKQLRINGYDRLSDIIFFTADQLKSNTSLSGISASHIKDAIQHYLNKYETDILISCNRSDLIEWDETKIRNRILGLYRNSPFKGFSLDEMITAAGFIDIPHDTIKSVIGKLLGEQKLEYVDFRCYRIYRSFETFLSECTLKEERFKEILQYRLRGDTFDSIGQNFGLTKERVRQLIKREASNVKKQHTEVTGVSCFDEDYYLYFFENYAFDLHEASHIMNIPESVWTYMDIMDVNQGKKELKSALEDHDNIDPGLRLKIKNYLNRNKIFIDNRWVEKKRAELEPIVVAKFCQNDVSFDDYAKIFNDFLADEDIPFDEDIYYTDAVMRTRENHLSESRFVLWKMNRQIRYYDIDSRDYTELIETLKLDLYENVEYSTLKFIREYPDLMKKYDIRDQYELHNLLKKIIPDGSYNDFHCGRMPHIRFGTFDRDSAIMDILIELAPVSIEKLCDRISEEYGYDSGIIIGKHLTPFSLYYHDGTYSLDYKIMDSACAESLSKNLPDDFYYLDEIRKIYAGLFPDADIEEINSYNLKSMGFVVLSRYAIRNYPTLDAYCEGILTKDDIVDIKPLRRRLTYVQMFSQKIMELKRNLDVVEFEPDKIINFRKLEQAGITKESIREYCDAVYDFVPDGCYFNSTSLRQDGFGSDLYELGFSDWFYTSLLLSDERFSFTTMFGNIVLYKGKQNITIQSFLVDQVCSHRCIDMYDLMTIISDNYGCNVTDKSDITFKLKNTAIYHDKDLDRLYANAELYYRDLDEAGGF